MRFIVDDNLPVALARWILTQGVTANHLNDISLAGAADTSIWDHAERSGSIIVTKDRDFMVRRLAAGQGPRLIWLRWGNTRKSALIPRLETQWPEIISRLEFGQSVLEIHG